jgi:DNA-binding transcriptional ArsR family regulator
MSGIFETKNKILKSLSSKPKTGRQLAQELGLSQATLTQHLHELEQKGLVHEADGSYSKRWKYYEVNALAYERFTGNGAMVRGAVAAFAAALVVLAIALFAVGTNAPAHKALPNISTNATTVSGETSAPAAVNALITPGGLQAATACPAIFAAESNITLGRIAGFQQYTVSNYTDLVIAPGSTGAINYTVTLAPLTGNENKNMTLHVYNRIFMYHNQSNSTMPNDTTPGITIAQMPANYTVPYPSSASSYNFSLKFNVSSSATQGTYWAVIALCEGYSKPMLITVGNRPYNGTVHVGPMVYA